MNVLDIVRLKPTSTYARQAEDDGDGCYFPYRFPYGVLLPRPEWVEDFEYDCSVNWANGNGFYYKKSIDLEFVSTMDDWILKYPDAIQIASALKNHLDVLKSRARYTIYDYRRNKIQETYRRGRNEVLESICRGGIVKQLTPKILAQM